MNLEGTVLLLEAPARLPSPIRPHAEIDGVPITSIRVDRFVVVFTMRDGSTRNSMAFRGHGEADLVGRLALLDQRVASYLVLSYRHKVKPEIRKMILKRDNFRCYLCACEVSPIQDERKRGGLPYATLDHVLPCSKGGFGNPDNLKTCCLPCNLAKADQVPQKRA